MFSDISETELILLWNSSATDLGAAALMMLLCLSYLLAAADDPGSKNGKIGPRDLVGLVLLFCILVVGLIFIFGELMLEATLSG